MKTKKAQTRSEIFHNYMDLHPEYAPVNGIRYALLSASQRIDAANIYKAWHKCKNIETGLPVELIELEQNESNLIEWLIKANNDR
jgi:hypothetical protein